MNYAWGGLRVISFPRSEPVNGFRLRAGPRRADLFALADKRPADVPPEQWEFMVGWTLLLYGN